MLYDLAHAVVAGILILGVIVILDRTGIVPRDKGKPHRWSWTLFFAIFASMLLLNLLWPYS